MSRIGPVTTTRFLIACAPRTGSTLLRLLLNSHPQVCCHGEVFAPALRGFVRDRRDIDVPSRPVLHQLRAEDPVKFLRSLVFLAGGAEAVGLKITYPTFGEPAWQAVVQAIRADTAIKIVHLGRANRLKRYVSHALARATGVNVVRDPSARPPIPGLHLSPRECLADIEATKAAEEVFRAMFRDHSGFELTYEELVDPSGARLDALQAFLGVAPAPLSSPTVKIAPENLREIIQNYAEIREAMQAAGYGRYVAN